MDHRIFLDDEDLAPSGGPTVINVLDGRVSVELGAHIRLHVSVELFEWWLERTIEDVYALRRPASREVTRRGLAECRARLAAVPEW